MARLDQFRGAELAAFGEHIRGIAKTAASMEDAAGQITSFLYDNLSTEDGTPACALVRLYKTHPYGKLPASLRSFAGDVLGDVPDDDVRCLTLLGTRGDEPAWNDRRASAGHQAIPLPTVDFVERLPMVAGVIEQLGLDIADVVRPPKHLLPEISQRTYGAFHVPEAAGSSFLPAQDFVAEHGIRSALGFGGVLYSGDFYAVLLFSRVDVTADTAETIRVLSLAVRVALLPFALRIFDEAEDGGAAARERVV